MELKWRKDPVRGDQDDPFNRTAYGIEICDVAGVKQVVRSFNRTAYGIEIEEAASPSDPRRSF